MKKFLFLLALLGPTILLAQVKIGAHPESIDAGSILELESSNKALVLTRLNNEQMLGLNPLRGALTYNSDTACLHYHNGIQWINLCTALTGLTFTDNGDGSITLEDGQGNETTFNGAPETVTTLVNNMDGTFTYTNEAGNETVINILNTDEQTLGTNGNPGHIEISNGNSVVLNVQDADSDNQNEIQNLEFNGGIISLSDNPGNTQIDLSNYDSDATDDFDGDWSSLTNIPADIADGDQNTVTNLVQDNMTGVVTYTNESAVDQTIEIISIDANNHITVGSDGGAYYESPIKAFGKIAPNGTILRATAGITITKLAGAGHYRVNLPLGMMSDANYIIQIAQPSREGAGNDDPSIAYLNQSVSSFEVIIGDNDNGGTDTGRFDSEFMFTLLDL